MTRTAVRRLELRNQGLRRKVRELQNARDLQNATLGNSLTSLVDSALLQSNLTSFNPILENNIYAPLTINWTVLTYMYKTHGVIQTAVDMPVLDAFRGGIDIHSTELDADDMKELADAMEEHGVLDVVAEAEIWARLYGGGAVIINTDQDPATPLSLKKLGKLEFYAASRWELGSTYRLSPGQAVNPWEAAATRMADTYEFYGHRLHKSRVLTMAGKAAPYIVRWQLAGWGMSEVERMVEDFNSFIKTKNVIYELLEEAKIDVYKLKDFKQNLATSAGTQLVQKRIEKVNQLKNFNRALLLDAEDGYEQKQITFAGLAELMKENRIGIASALRIPMTKLFGLSASGFSSGEDDIENYNAMVESEVRQPMRKVVRKILNLLSAATFGEAFDLSFEYKPLRVLSSKEEEDVKTSKHNRIISLYDRGLIDSKEVGDMLEKDKLVSIETAASKGILDPHPAPPQAGGFDHPADVPVT